MIKVIPSSAFDFGMPVAQLVDVHSRGIDRTWMSKRAAVLTSDIADIRPEPGHSIIHLISLGAMERYGINRNGDGFNKTASEFTFPNPKEGVPKTIKLAGGLLEFHPTFMTHGHVFKHHQNTDPAKAIGEIKAAAYNDDMDRGELLIRVPHNHEWEDELQKLASGRDIAFSMACKVPYDICTECGNRARTRAEYCPHLSDHMTEITKAGNQIGAINDRPTYFDISKVIRPADRIAWSLQKVAFDLAPMGGAQLAEMMEVSASPAILIGDGPAGYARKMAAARKLAEIEKQIEGVARGDQFAGACPRGDMAPEVMDRMGGCKLTDVMNGLNDAKICLSAHDFVRLVTGQAPVPDDLSQVEEMLPGMYSRLLNNGGADACAMDGSYDPQPGAAIPRSVRELMERTASDHSLNDGPAQARLRIMIIRGGHTPKLASYKQAAVSKAASALANEYAKYQLAFVSALDNDPVGSRLTVLRNYLKV